MKNLFKTSFILLALMGVLFTSCKKDYEVPTIPVLPVGELYSIDDLLALPANTSFTEASVCGIVTADEQSGNLYKAIFIQDRKSGKAIELMMNTSSAARIGDSVRVFLDKNLMVNNYHNLPQIVGIDGKGFSPDGHLIIYPFNDPIEPATVTIADIKTGNFTAGLVKLNDVEFVEQGSAFCNPGENTNRNLKDATGEIIVRTSNYANFAYDLMPTGKGSLVAIASVYNNDWQLILRSKKDMKFEGGEPTPPSPAGEVQHLPYTQSFASEFGSYTTFDELGEQSWMIDYSTAKITGHEGGNPGENYANIDWLISSPVDLSGVSDVKMTMSYIGRYFTNISSEVTIWASTDYVYGDDPTVASWRQVPANLSEGSNWNDFLTAEISLSEYAGQTACFAVKYTSTDQKAGTMEIKSITIEEGGSVGPNPPAPGGEVQSMPYSQSFASDFGSYLTKDVLGPQSWTIKYESAWISGHEGGTGGTDYENDDWLISSPVMIEGVEHAKVVLNYAAKYNAPMAQDVTMLVSTDYEWDGDPQRANWDVLMDNIENNSTGNAWTFTDKEASLDSYLGQTVTVAVRFRSTANGSRTFEIKNITVEEGTGTGPTPPPGPGTGSGSGTADDPYNVAAGISNQNWNHSTNPENTITAWVQGYIVGAVKAGNNSVSSNDQVNWEAPFDLSTNVIIADDVDCREITQCLIVNLPPGKPLREQVNLMNNPDNLGHRLAVLGKLCPYFAQAGLRDSKGNAEDFVLEGYTPPTPPPQQGYFSESFMYDQGTFTIQNVELGGLDYVWAHNSGYQCMKASSYVSSGNATESWLVSPAIVLPWVNVVTMTFEQAVNYANPSGWLSVMITTNYTGDVTTTNWTELELDQWPSGNNWDFITSQIDLRQYVDETVVIAFKYTSSTSVNPAWEVRNIVIF